MRVSNKWSECYINWPGCSPVGIIVNHQVLVKVDRMNNKACWIPLHQWKLSQRKLDETDTE